MSLFSGPIYPLILYSPRHFSRAPIWRAGADGGCLYGVECALEVRRVGTRAPPMPVAARTRSGKSTRRQRRKTADDCVAPMSRLRPAFAESPAHSLSPHPSLGRPGPLCPAGRLRQTRQEKSCRRVLALPGGPFFPSESARRSSSKLKALFAVARIFYFHFFTAIDRLVTIKNRK